ncbi:cholinesterase-like protein, partial [Leptotrombidium deliense]
MFFIYTNIVRSSARTTDKYSRQSSLATNPTVIAGHEFVVIKTPIGSLKGTKVKELGGSVYKFLGVPYATSPVGELRFKRPVPIKPWRGVLNATTFADECIQDYDKALGS